MAGYTGKNLYLKFSDTVLDTDYRTFSLTDEGGVVDQSAGADTRRGYLATLTDGSASASILLQASDTATWSALAPTTEATLEWGEEGTTAGLPKHTVLAIVTGRTQNLDYADVTTVDIAWQLNGDITDSTY